MQRQEKWDDLMESTHPKVVPGLTRLLLAAGCGLSVSLLLYACITKVTQQNTACTVSYTYT